MLRRSTFRRVHHMTDPNNSPIHGYSPFGWHYLNSGAIDRPRLHNRNFGLTWHGHQTKADRSIQVDISKEMHPTFQLALKPYLEKLKQRADAPEEVLKEYLRVAPRMPVKERHALLAKVAEFCAHSKSYAPLKEIWERDGKSMYSDDSGNKPALPLLIGMTWAAAAAGAPEWKFFFEQSQVKRWDMSMSFPVTLWGVLLRCAGQLKDQQGVVDILNEMIDCRAYIDVIPGDDFVTAINCITEPGPYEQLKKVLYEMPNKLIGNAHAAYLRLRMSESIPQNDILFYHFHWHFRIRRPMHFLPRRLYFDHFPSQNVEALGRSNAPTQELLAQRVQQWKDEGVLPEDYKYEIKVHDIVANVKEINKKEPWRRPKMKLPKHMDPRAKAG
eukprot:PhM_4_TR4161/c0_g1_i1/m.34976